MRVETSSHVRTVTPRFGGVIGCALHFVQISRVGGVCFRLKCVVVWGKFRRSGIAAYLSGRSRAGSLADGGELDVLPLRFHDRVPAEQPGPPAPVAIPQVAPRRTGATVFRVRVSGPSGTCRSWDLRPPKKPGPL